MNRKYAHWIGFLKKEVLVKVSIALSFIWLASAYLVYRIESPLEHSNIKTLGDAVWWGIVTFLTVGYGDRYPISTEGRMIAAILMTAGVISIGIVTAKISSHF